MKKRLELAHVTLDAVLFLPDWLKGNSVTKDVLSGEYEFELIGNDLRILDAGGYVGDFAIWAAHRFPGRSIVSYEPNKDLFDCMVLNTKHYKVECINKALGSTGEPLTLSFCKEEPGTGTTEGENISSGHEFRQIVDTDKPQDIGKFDIVKVDTEGAEVDILAYLDLSETLAVMVEVHSDSKRRLVEDIMNKNDFEVRGYKKGFDGVGVWCFTKKGEVPMYLEDKGKVLNSLYVSPENFNPEL